uniref:Secreted protein n=1 Tax=Ixodes ricinus TaxID=34613 RepID=A0A6B0TXK1_IXORI
MQSSRNWGTQLMMTVCFVGANAEGRGGVECMPRLGNTHDGSHSRVGPEDITMTRRRLTCFWRVTFCAPCGLGFGVLMK